jgi:putative DNA primase/helicase
MENRLGNLLVNVNTIQHEFADKLDSVLGKDTKQSNDNLSVFYKEDILSQLKENNTPMKLDNDMFYIYNGSYWESIEDSKMKRFIITYIRKRGELKHTSSTIVEGAFKNLKLQLGGYDYIKSESVQFINVLNGTLAINKKNVSLLKHDKEHHLDYVLDFNYDPKETCPIWQNFLNDVIPNRETQKTLQEVIGNLLIRGLKIEVLPFLYGTGGNGKSVVLEVLTGLFGRENVATYSLTKITTDEKVRARIADGKIMNLSSENNMGNVNVDVAKNYSSGEPLDARLNYGNPFEVYNYAKFLGNVNKLNVMDGERTEAIARRQIIIPFTKTISAEKKDINIHHKILSEKSGVLNWIIQGIREVVKNEDIYKSREVKSILAEYQESTNPVALLIKEHGYSVLNENTPKKNFTKLSDLFNVYKEFTTEIRVGTLSRQNFKSDLLALKGVNEFKHNNVSCFNLSNTYEDEKPSTYKEILEQNKDNLNDAQREVLERKAEKELL